MPHMLEMMSNEKFKRYNTAVDCVDASHPVHSSSRHLARACCAVTAPSCFTGAHVSSVWMLCVLPLRPGGHFAAMEEPDALAEDMINFFSKYH
jgi:hypothetical protein